MVSIGHYEGDTLVVDTIGLNDKTFVDNYRTPHTEKLHVVERWTLLDGGKTRHLAMIGMVETRVERNGTVARERRYYLSSTAHWGIENRLH
jgi:hypothetical protein